MKKEKMQKSTYFFNKRNKGLLLIWYMIMKTITILSTLLMPWVILLIPNKRRNAMKTNFNEETTKFLDNLNHSHRDLIEALRKIILEMKI